MRCLANWLPVASAGKTLGFLDFARLDRFDGNPHPLDLTTRQFHPHSLQIRSKDPFVHFYQLQTNPAGFLGLALAYDATALAGALSGDGAYSGHDSFSWVKSLKRMSREGSKASFFTRDQGCSRRFALKA